MLKDSVIIEIKTMKFNEIKFVLYVILSILTVGIPLLLVHW